MRNQSQPEPGSSAPAETGRAAAALFRAGRHAELAELAVTAEVLFWQAAQTAEGGDPAQAIALLRRARLLDPRFEPARAALGYLSLEAALVAARAGAWVNAAAAFSEARNASRKLIAGGASALPVLEALVLVWADRREEAIAILEQALRPAPPAPLILHTFLLVCYHTARAWTENGDPDQARIEELWHRVIAAWVALAADAAFWRVRRQSVGERYGGGARGPDRRRQLLGEIEQQLTRGWLKFTDPQRLGLLLRREKRATELLNAGGGLRLPEQASRRLACGPLMIHCLGLDLPLRAWVAREAGGSHLSLRFFSNLGLAQVLLEEDLPSEALIQLVDLRCPRCRTVSSASSAVSGGEAPQFCAPACCGFAALNPAAADGHQGRADLLREAVRLGSDARLAVAKLQLTAVPVDLSGALESLRAALALARQAGDPGPFQDRVRKLAAGRAESLHRQGRWDEAVAELEALAGILGPEAARALSPLVVENLTDRGIAAAEARPPRWQEAVTDLSRATDLSPHAQRPLLNLLRVLRAWAEEERWYQPQAAVARLEKACDRLAAVEEHFAGRSEIEAERQKAAAALQGLVDALATDLACRDRRDEALALLTRVLRRFPAEPLLLERCEELARSVAGESAPTANQDGWKGA